MQMKSLIEMEHSGLIPLLQHNKYDDLARMYTLFKRVDGGMDMMRNVMGAHLRVTGTALVQDPERTKDPVEFVQRLLTEKEKYDR